VAVATLLRLLGVWAFSHAPSFAIYFPAILGTGLLAGVPAALGAAIASILIIAWAFMPPYFEFQVAQRIDQINILFNADYGGENSVIESLSKNWSTVEETSFQSSTSSFKRHWPMIPKAPGTFLDASVQSNSPMIYLPAKLSRSLSRNYCSRNLPPM